jgi:hypothetical protein
MIRTLLREIQRSYEMQQHRVEEKKCDETAKVRGDLLRVVKEARREVNRPIAELMLECGLKSDVEAEWKC